ncbi:MAG: AAA family ATPase [Phycisphaerae bacterium]|nr:AAA family ATPase [Saprospiraceae bacterium]
MRITSITLENFKRFTHLELRDIPASAKLVLLIGANGSGKSSIFDAFEWIRKPKKIVDYYEKKAGVQISALVTLTDGQTIHKVDQTYPVGAELISQFYGRSSNRIMPRIAAQGNIGAVKNDEDAPQFYIDADNRFQNDVFKYISDINQALRAPTFEGKSADTLEIFKSFIDPFNQSLRNVLGNDENTAIQILRFEEADTPGLPAKLLFKKGEVEINYDLLSHGEKQVVTLLLNFLVRDRYHQKTIFFIDEMDAHLNTALQYALLKEIVETWIPEGCQLWTASHSLGFIRFAQESPEAVTFDLDELDFDLPQTLFPVPKEHVEVYDIAVGKDFLSSLLKLNRLFFVEGNDKNIYASLNLPGLLFIGELKRNAVFHKVRSGQYSGIVDRDYLTDDDVKIIREHYHTLFVLDYYSIENYLFHPENLADYHHAHGVQFDREKYAIDIKREKNKVKKDIDRSIPLKRTEYPYFKEPESKKPLFRKRFANEGENLEQAKMFYTLLESENFEDFYKILPMKTYCTQLVQRQNIAKSDLAKTNWFAEKIKLLLNS